MDGAALILIINCTTKCYVIGRGKRRALVRSAKVRGGLSSFSCLLGLLLKCAFPMGSWHLNCCIVTV